jgi:hypothetical protein
MDLMKIPHEASEWAGIITIALLLAAPTNAANAGGDPADGNACIVSGCSGQICGDKDFITTCEWRPEYACYRQARCERDSAGKCGWRMTDELQTCLAQERKRSPG